MGWRDWGLPFWGGIHLFGCLVVHALCMAGSLLGWAAGRGPKERDAWLPSIPEFGEVLEAWGQGVKGCLIREWLRDECGYGSLASISKVETWLRNHHPR